MNWNWSNTTPRQPSFNIIRTDGSQKKLLKEYSIPWGYINTRPAEFREIYIEYHVKSDKNDGSYIAKYDEYKDGKVAAADFTEAEFNSSYPFYSVSPTGDKTLWSEYRDGKNVFFVGDAKGESGREIGRSDEFIVYGWFSDDYVLLTKKGSEMHILPGGGTEDGVEKSLKISDYYKPESYYNRGLGYGG